MKPRIALVLCTVIAVASLGGCNLLGRMLTPGPDIDLQATASEVTPVFSESAARSLGSTSRSIDDSSPLYHLWYCLQEYVDEIHGGEIDGSNIYKFLYDANIELENAFRHSQPIEPTQIAAPFDFGEAAYYDHAANREETEDTKHTKFGTAYRVDGDEVTFLLTSHWDEDYANGGQLTLCQIQGTVNQATGDIDMSMTYVVSYSNGEHYTVRSDIAGNQTRHEFECRVGVFNQIGESVSGTSFAGAGVSQGAGNTFLIKLDVWDGTSWSGEAYYVFPADADADTIAAMDPAGYADTASLPGSVSTYVPTVDSLELFQWDEVPHTLSDFNGGSVTLDF